MAASLPGISGVLATGSEGEATGAAGAEGLGLATAELGEAAGLGLCVPPVEAIGEAQEMKRSNVETAIRYFMDNDGIH